jgi:deazaflavin-dependent oxidoreductase (nitroreductase family)
MWSLARPEGVLEMLGVILGLVAALAIGVAAIGIIFVLGMRAKSPIVQGAIIWLGKHAFNRVQLKTAGTPGAYAAIIRHRGRVSGEAYETPVGAFAMDDTILIALPYGRSNWARNVLAAGEATLVFEGETFGVDSPEMIPLSTVETVFEPREQRMHRIFGVTDVLRLRRVQEPRTAPAARAMGVAA